MSARDPHDRPGLRLLVQLFGRDVLDRLERAGFGDEAAICSAPPDRLATTTGVSLGLAQRIIAVVEETRLAAPGEIDAPLAPEAKPAREPRRRKPRPAPEEAKAAETRVEAVRAKMEADDADPFVDDVALVSWMGFSSKTPAGRLNFSVADRILDPIRPETTTAPEPPTPAPAAEAAETRPPAPRPEPAPRRTLPGSFWTFGRPRAARPAPDATAQDAPAPQPAATPEADDLKKPRKVRDDH